MPSSSSSISPAVPVEALAGVLDLSVIIVNYNVREFLEQALRSVCRACGGLAAEILVVDNNSVDGSVEMVRRDFPQVRLIANEENAGFGRANNQAIRQARGRYLLILNPDTIVQEDTLTTLVRFMDAHPDAGAVGCQILNPDGTFAPESRRAFPTPRVAFYRMIGLSRLFPRSPRFGRYNLTYLPRDAVAEVDALSGSCMLVRHAALYHDRGDAPPAASDAGAAPLPSPRVIPPSGVLPPSGHHRSPSRQPSMAGIPRSPGTPRDDREKDGSREPTAGSREPTASTGAGLFDEDFFMYGEDLDWCYRIQQAGWKIYYTPETQIIHYKGESTKKGELRYVRLFYGAMLLFTQKHFQDRYSRLFAGMLRAGIMVRAALSMAGNAARRLAVPLADFGLVYAIVAVVGLIRSAPLDVTPSPLFFVSVPPGYALGTVAGIALAGGYRWGRTRRLRPALLGAVMGLLVVAAASFFVKNIAFSRAVVLISFPMVALALVAGRLARRRRLGIRQAVLIGEAAEAHRLHRMLAGHPHPPFELTGYVWPDAAADGGPVRRLGTFHHVRDLVRLNRFDDVVFAEDSLSHRTIFRLIRTLRDLPVQFRMLSQGREHVIGKASIDDLSAPPILAADHAVGMLRSHPGRRAFEIPVAVLGLLAHPFLRLVALRNPDGPTARLAARTRFLPRVLTGRMALIGFHPEEAFTPPAEWNLRPGVFAITDSLHTPTPTVSELNRAYWFYVSHQSASLDWDILVRSLRNLYHEPRAPRAFPD